jgi:transposase
VFKFHTGVPWEDLPERFGPWQTVHGRFARWAADGTFDRRLAAAQQRAEVDWLVALDSTIGRAPQHTAAKGGSMSVDSDAPAGKIRLACDGRGRPLSFMVTAGTRNDCTWAETVIDEIRDTQSGPGRPRVRPERVVADKGYSARAFRAYLRRRGIKATIPERVDQLAGRLRRRERPAASTGPSTAAATSSNAASTASSNGAASPPAATNSLAATLPPSLWPAHSSGSIRDRQDATQRMTTAPAIELRTSTDLGTARNDLVDVYAEVRAALLHLPNDAVTAFGERLHRHGGETGFVAVLAYA